MAELFMARSFSYKSNLYFGGKYIHCSGVNGRTCPSLSDYRTHSQVICLPLKFRNKRALICCKAGSNSQRRNPDFSRNNRQGFSRGRIRQMEERDRDRDGFDNFDEPDMLSSKNGPLLSSSGFSKSQVTSLPGPREKEIVELFRKVQAQLRERAAMKEEKKLESTRGKGKESETVDSLLKLLRKHSAEQSRRSDVTSEKEYSVQSDEEKSESFFGLNTTISQEQPSASLSRPPSKFRRVSPVPRVKYQPISITNEKDDENPDFETDINGSSVDMVETGDELNYKPVSEPGPEIEPVATVVSDTIAYDVSESGLLDTDEVDEEHDDGQEPVDDIDLTTLKLVELREIAKSRGFKGFSKMKKSELLELLTKS